MEFKGKADLWWRRVTAASVITLGLVISTLIVTQKILNAMGSDKIFFFYDGDQLFLIVLSMVCASLAVFLRLPAKRYFQGATILAALYFFVYFVLAWQCFINTYASLVRLYR